MQKKTAWLVTIALLLTLTSCSQPREQEVHADAFPSWNQDAPALEALITYVEDITEESAPSFIPAEDRIAVFDMDGTLMCELYPAYFEWLMFVHRALEDTDYTAPDDVRQAAEGVLTAIEAGNQWPPDMGETEALMGAKAFVGMTIAQYEDYVRTFMETPAEGFTNMTRGDAFYLPMLEVIAYLQQNSFLVYIVTGTDRCASRVLIEEVINIPPRQVMGMDVSLVASGQDGRDGLDYVFAPEDMIERGEALIIKNVKMNKLSLIAQEIGRQPVLAFGNSSGDASMMTYTVSNNPYQSQSFLVVNDDTEREYGTQQASDKMKAAANSSGWTVISMKNDFKTIYGDDVAITGTPR